MIYIMGLIISCLVTGYVFFEIMGTLYEKKYAGSNLIYFIALILYVALGIGIAYMKIPILNVVYSMAALCGLSYGLYHSHGKNVLVNSAIVIVYLAIIDILVTTIFSTIASESAYSALQNSEFFLVSGIGNALVMLCTSNLLLQLLVHCRISGVSKVLHIYMVFLLAFELSTLYYFLKGGFDVEHNIALLLMSLGFVVVDGGVLYLYKAFSQNAHLEKRAELMEQQREMTAKYYEGLQERYEQSQRFLHDIKNHIRVLGDLDDEAQKSLKKDYSEELVDTIDAIQQQFQCSDRIVSAIIWDKIQVCKNEDIGFKINMQDIKFDFMSKMEVTMLFFNLLDNAIEACQGCKNDKKEIILRIHRFKDYIVIKMRNTIGSQPKWENGSLVTTKEGHLGMGMEILGALANKYCGNLNYECVGDMFEIKIILSSIGKEQEEPAAVT